MHKYFVSNGFVQCSKIVVFLRKINSCIYSTKLIALNNLANYLALNFFNDTLKDHFFKIPVF